MQAITRDMNQFNHEVYDEIYDTHEVYEVNYEHYGVYDNNEEILFFDGDVP